MRCVTVVSLAFLRLLFEVGQRHLAAVGQLDVAERLDEFGFERGRFVELAEPAPCPFLVLREPEHVVVDGIDQSPLLTALLLERKRHDEVLIAEHVRHGALDDGEVVIADLDENAAAARQKVAREKEAIAQVREV